MDGGSDAEARAASERIVRCANIPSGLYSKSDSLARSLASVSPDHYQIL